MTNSPIKLDDKRRQQLDANLRAMSEQGASPEDIKAYAQDFKNKFGQPPGKSVPEGSGAPSGDSPAPSSQPSPSAPASSSTNGSPWKNRLTSIQEQAQAPTKIPEREQVDIEQIDIEQSQDNLNVPVVNLQEQFRKEEEAPVFRAVNYMTFGGKRANDVTLPREVDPNHPETVKEGVEATAMDYLDYLTAKDKNLGENTRSKYLALKQKEDKTSGDEEFLRKVESDALEIRHLSEQNRLVQLSKEIEAEQDPIRRSMLMGEYGKTKQAVEGIETAYAANPGNYLEIATKEGSDKATSELRSKEIAENDKTTLGKIENFANLLGTGIVKAVGESTSSIGQVPKVLGDIAGDTDYDWADKLYDEIENVHFERESDFGTSGLKDLPTYAKIANIGGQALGSALTFAGGGMIGGTVGLGARAGTFTTAFLTSEPGYYQEALNSGMNPQEAATAATYLATVTAAIESTIPDVKYFEPGAFRNSVLQSFQKGLSPQQAVKEAVKAIPESAKAYLKSGVKEAGEEVAGQLGEDVAKESMNAFGEKEYFKDTFNPENYAEAALGGFMAGTGLSVFSRPQPRSPLTETTMLDAVENKDATLNGVPEEQKAEVEEVLNQAGENLKTLKTHSNWENLSREDQAHALSVVQDINTISEENKGLSGLGVTDTAKEEQVAKLTEELNQTLSKEAETETAPETEAETAKPLDGMEPSTTTPMEQGEDIQITEEMQTEAAPVETAPASTEQSVSEEPKVEEAASEEDASFEPKEGKKSLLNRAYEGTAPEDIKESIAKHGLTYDVEKQADAKKSAKAFIDEVGAENAIRAVRDSQVNDGQAAYVFSEVIDRLGTEITTETDPAKIRELQKLETDLIEEFDRKARSGGRFISALGEIYRTSDFGYKLSTMKSRYKEMNKGVLPEDVEQRIEQYDKELKEIKKKLAEAEERETARLEQESIVSIREEVKRKAPKDKEIRTTLANRIRKAKAPKMFAAQSQVVPVGALWDSAVELVATSVEAGEAIGKAIRKGVKLIQDSDWYKSLTADEQAEAEKEFRDALKTGDEITMEDGRIKIPGAIIREKVASGIDNIQDLTNSILEDISEDFPDVTERQVRDAITGYGKEVGKNRDELRGEVAKMKRVGKLMSQLEDLQNRIKREKGESRKQQFSEQEKELKRQIRNLSKEIPLTDSERKKLDEGRLSASKNRIQSQIEEYQRRIDKKDFSTVKRPKLEDTELSNLKAEQVKWRQQYEKELYDAQLRNRNGWAKAGDAILETWNLTRALMATSELSFILLQGGLQSIAHPRTAVRALYKMFSHFGSEARAEKWHNLVKAQPWYDEMKKDGLAISETDARLSLREELFISGWLNHIWDYFGYPLNLIKKEIPEYKLFGKNFRGGNVWDIWKRMNPTKAIERAATSYLNTLRLLRYIDGRQMLELQGKTHDSNPEDYKNMADVINTLSGRASLGKLQSMNKALSFLFFSPRNWASVLKQVTPLAFYHFGKMHSSGDKFYKPSVAQKMAMWDFLKYVGLTMAFIQLVLASNDEEDEEDEKWKLSTDPTSSDFMKLRRGDVVTDPWGGRQQMVVYQMRLLQNAIEWKTGREDPLGTGSDATSDVLTKRLLRSKASPSLGMVLDISDTKLNKRTGERKDKDGRTVSNIVEEHLYPIFWGTLSELHEETPGDVEAALDFYSLLGGGVQVYPEKAQKESKAR